MSRQVMVLLIFQSIFEVRCSGRLPRSVNEFEFGGGLFGSPLGQVPFGPLFGGGGPGLGLGSSFGGPFPFSSAFGALPFGAPPFGAHLFGAPPFGTPPFGAPPFGAPPFGAPLFPPPPIFYPAPPPPPPPPFAATGQPPAPIIIPAKTAATISIASLLHALIARKFFPPVIPIPFPRPVPFPFPVKVPVPIAVDRPVEYTVLKPVAYEEANHHHEQLSSHVEEWSPTESHVVQQH